MLTFLLIIILILIIVYLYYQNRKLSANSADNSSASPVIFDSENEDLIAEKDLAIRTKNETEAENLSLNNRLKLKHQEISRKEAEIERLKKEASQKEIALNKKITEKNGLITTLTKEINQHKDKYSKQGKLLDEEQLEHKKALENLVSLTGKLTQLKTLINSLTLTSLTKKHWEQIKEVVND